MTSLAAVLAVNLVALQPATVSLDLPGVTLSTFVERLSEETGRAYSVDDGLKREVVAIRVRGMEVGVLQQHVADVVYGKWEGDRLVTDRNRVGREFFERDSRVDRAIRAHQKDLVRLLEIRGSDGEGPMDAGRMLISLLADVPKEIWKKGVAKGSVYLSTDPNQMEEPLSLEKYESAIKAWIKRENSDRLDVMHQTYLDYKYYDLDTEVVHELEDPKRKAELAGVIDETPVRAVATLTPTLREVNGDFELTALIHLAFISRSGDVVLQDVFDTSGISMLVKRLTGELGEDDLRGPIKSRKFEGALPKEEIPINPVERGFLPRNPSPEQKETWRNGIREFLGEQEIEPLAWRVGAVLSAYAELGDKDLVAYLADEDDLKIASSDGVWMTNEVEWQLLDGPTVELNNALIKKRATWDHAMSRKGMDGKRLMEHWRKAVAQTEWSIDEKAEFFWNWNQALGSAAIGEAMAEIFPESLKAAFEYSNDGSSVWGSLTVGERTKLRDGERLAVWSLNSQTRAFLGERLAGRFGQTQSLSDIDRRPVWEHRKYFICGMGLELPQISRVEEIVSEAMPEGFPSGSFD